MIIGVAGPYSATTAKQRKTNLDRLNTAAAKLIEMGHIPLIGILAALPVLKKYNGTDKYKIAMDISLAVISACDALWLLDESPGANREAELISKSGKPIYRSVDEIPAL